MDEKYSVDRSIVRFDSYDNVDMNFYNISDFSIIIMSVTQ